MKILGIDLGTTNSAVGVVNKHGRPELIANRDGDYITPSAVFFEDEQPIVGAIARRSAALDPESLAQYVKRQMGSPSWAFFTPGGHKYSAEEISSFILRRLKEDAEAFTGESFTQAVISVPAYFQEPERQATIDAARMAKLEVPRIINEPTAAGLAFAVDREVQGAVVVYDLGGGTFDATVLDVQPDELKVRATGGNRSLGGFNWDNALIEHIGERFEEATGSPLPADPAADQDVRDKAEKAKIDLSRLSSTKIVLSSPDGPQVIRVTRDEFEDMTLTLLDTTRVILEEVLEDAKLDWSGVQRVLLVGGSTKMPAVGAMLERLADKPPSKEVHPDEAVALGAALQAAMLAAGQRAASSQEAEPEDVSIVEVPDVVDVAAHSLGVVLIDSATNQPYNDITIPRNTELPCSVSKVYRTIHDGQALWHVRVTQGEERDLRYVKVVGEGEIAHPPRPAGHPMRVDWRYDNDSIVEVAVFDGETGTPLGETKLKRESSLSSEEIEETAKRLGDMTLE
ncbi:MAG TPA: Hsp70 family protein [Solirubrobacteraceae bacterium]|jgi:molecular chaperone DnaK|nr:Hsp70 family protein [Solirubrobacteraceae bacterium]